MKKQFLLLIALLFMVTGAMAQTIFPLNPPTGYTSIVITAINDNGMAVGYYANTSGGLQAFAWTEGGGMIMIGNQQYARGMNNAEQIVGDDKNGNSLFWANSTTPAVIISAAGTNGGIAKDINDNGLVVGRTGNNIANPRLGYIWNSVDNSFQTVNVQELNAINNGCLTTGSAILGSGRQGLYDYCTSQLSVIGDNGTWAFGTDINASGTLIISQTGGYFIQSGTTLTPLPGAQGINDLGQVVGANLNKAYIWENNVSQDLNDILNEPTWDFRYAEDINNNGWIVGSGVFNGQNVAFVYKPAPPPVLPVHNITQNLYYNTIQPAIDAANAGDVIEVAAGTYDENVTINKNISLYSVDGAAATIINGVNSGTGLGTIFLTTGRDGVNIGATGKGFTIIGIDGAPGLEKAALYLQGAQSNITIIDNIIVANGDAGLMAEYNAVNNNVTISDNEITGKTFVGDNPAGVGFGAQFTLHNVPRQLVVFGGGPGTTNTQNIIFTDNTISGIAGGMSITDNAGNSIPPTPQGNTMVTLDLVGTNTITGNTFSGTTTRYAEALRVRGAGTYTITGNTFNGSYPLNTSAGTSDPSIGIARTASTYLNNIFTKAVIVKDAALNVKVSSIPTLIQAGVALGMTTDVIEVSAGTYTEQVLINKENLTISGAGVGQTIIKSPATLATSFGTTKAVVCANTIDNVNLKNLTIDGDGKGNANNKFVGLAFWNSGGNVDDVNVIGVRDTPFSGAQHGVAVYAYNDDSGPYTIKIDGMTVNDFQKNAFALSGTGLTVDLDNIIVTGAGSTSVTAQNGIQIGFGAGGTVDNATISGIDYIDNVPPVDWTAAAVLLYNGGKTDLNNVIITNSQTNVYFIDTEGSFKNGSITVPAANYWANGIDIYASGAKGGKGMKKTPSPFEEDFKESGSRGTVNVTIDNNTFTGVMHTDCYGVGAVARGTINLTITGNNINNWDYGILAYEYTGGSVNVTASSNNLSGNDFGFYYDTEAKGIIDASNNYWGTIIGSEIEALVSDNVNYIPWCNSDFTICNYGIGGSPGPVATIAAVAIECADDDIAVPVTVTDFNNVGAISLVLNYDHTLLSVPLLEGVDFNSAIASAAYDVPANGVLTISFFGNEGVNLANGATLFTINFEYVGAACPDDIVSDITFDYSVAGYCEYAPPGLSEPFTTNPPADYFIAGSISIERTTPPSEVDGPVATSSTVECVSDAVAPTTLPVIKDVCGITLSPTAGSPIKNSVNHLDFSTAVTTGPTQAPGVWYTDRYAPAGFISPVVFDGGDRLKHSIDAADFQGQASFYRTQGRKYDLGAGTDYMEIRLYIPSDWATANKRMAGFWGTAFDASNVISGYPIVEFASDNNIPRFQVWEGNAGWVSIGLPTGFAYDSWYLLKIKILPSGQFLYSAGDLNYTTVSYGNSGSVRMGNVILQGYNYDPVDPLTGVTYDIYWDDFMWNDTYSAPACEGIISYTYNYVDCAGLAYSWIYTYTIDHITAPIVPADGGSTVQCYADALVEPTPPVVTDVCGTEITGVLADVLDTPDPFTNPGTRIYTFTFTDCAGLESEWKYTYTIDDTTPPSITCPDNITQTAGAGVCYAIITNLGTPVIADNCTDVNDLIVTNNAPANSEYPIGSTIVTWTVQDAAGNIATCEQTVTVTDVEAPIISCPANITVNINESVNPSVTGFATAFDLCGTVTITFSDAWAAGTCVGTGTITRTWKAKDEANNEATCTQTITVVDNNTPAIVCPSDITVVNDAGQCSAEVAFSLPSSMDPGYNEGWENENFVMGDYFGWNEYNSTISSVASGTDGINSKSGLRHGLIVEPASGYTGVFSRIGGYNNSFCNGYRVSLDVYMDLTDPAVLADTYGWDLSVGSSKQDGGHLRDFIFHTASNANGEILVGASNNSNFARRNDIATLNHHTITSTGWYTFEWIFHDEAGALAVDLNLLDGNGAWLWTETRTNAADLIATIVGGNRYMWFTFVATEKLAIDNAEIQRNAGVTSDYPSGYAFPVGTTTVTVTSTDCCGNTSDCTFEVTVTDSELPTITCPTPAASYYVNVGSTWVATGLDAIIADNCGTPVLSYSVDGGANFTPGSANGYAFPMGVTPVIYKVTDASNNVATCTFDITVTGIDISGAVTYYNSSNTAMTNVIVKLQQSGTDMYTGTTGPTGSYSFSNVVPGTYDVVFSTVKPVGGINSSDAAQVNFWGVNQSSIEKVRFYAGDVNNSNSISGADAGSIQAYFLTMGANAFLRSPWTFWTAGETISANPVAVENPELVVPAGGPIVNQDFYALVTGDFNRSFTPGGAKSTSESLGLIYGEVIEIAPNTAFELPINAAIDMEVGAVSLIMNVPANQLEVQGVYLTNDPATPVNYSVTGDELRISWYSLTPINLNVGDALLTLQLFATDLSGNDNIYLSLAADPLNELADGSYNVIEDALISVDIIKATALGIGNPDLAGKLHFANYPNPFKGNTNFAFTVPTDGNVTLEVYNITGTSVMVMLDQVMPAGDHLVRMDAGALKPGVYMATLTLKDNETMLRKTIKVIAY